MDFVRLLGEKLESPQIGLRLFIRDRDLKLGNWEYETFATLIERQCRRVIVVLSPDFLLCSDCKFQSQFATGLAIEKRSRILIPIIYKPCDMPSIIRMLTKINMTNVDMSKDIPVWTLNRLVMSIQDNSSHLVGNNNQNRMINYSDNSRPAITFPKPPNDDPNTPNIIELATESHHWDKSNMDTTISTISTLTIGDDDQKELLSRDYDLNSNIRSSPSSTQNSDNTQQNGSGSSSKSKDWFNSIKRKIKVRL